MLTIEDLEAKVTSLESIIKVMQEAERARLRSEFQQTYHAVRAGLLSTTNIENEIEKLYEKLGISALLTDLIKINNPYSDRLGFQFTRIVEKIVEDVLFTDLTSGGDNAKRNRLLNIVRKVINNPIADALLKSNPISGVVANVITSASNFVDATVDKVERVGVGKAIKHISVITKDEIRQEKIEAFKSRIQKYVIFYEQMLKVTEVFETRIKSINSSFNGLYLTYRNYGLEYQRTLGVIANTDMFVMLDELFEIQKSSQDAFDFQAILQKSSIRSAIEFLSTIKDTRSNIEKHKLEFSEALREFVRGYIAVLRIPISANWTHEEIDRSKLTEVIRNLEAYIASNTTARALRVPGGNEVKLIALAETPVRYTA